VLVSLADMVSVVISELVALQVCYVAMFDMCSVEAVEYTAQPQANDVIESRITVREYLVTSTTLRFERMQKSGKQKCANDGLICGAYVLSGPRSLA
jgi:hypothetical protein